MGQYHGVVKQWLKEDWSRPIKHGAGEETHVDWHEVQAIIKGLMGKREEQGNMFCAP